MCGGTTGGPGGRGIDAESGTTTDDAGGTSGKGINIGSGIDMDDKSSLKAGNGSGDDGGDIDIASLSGDLALCGGAGCGTRAGSGTDAASRESTNSFVESSSERADASRSSSDSVKSMAHPVARSDVASAVTRDNRGP